MIDGQYSPRGNEAVRSGCQARTKQGLPCAGFALTDRGFCLSHDPTRAADARQARAKGGAAGSKLRALKGQRAKLNTAAGLIRFTSGVIQDALDGRLTPDVARVVLYGLSIQRQLVEAGELEQRLAQLEEQLAAATAQRRV